MKMVGALLAFVELIAGSVSVCETREYPLICELGERSIYGSLSRVYFTAFDYLFCCKAFAAMFIEEFDQFIALFCVVVVSIQFLPDLSTVLSTFLKLNRHIEIDNDYYFQIIAQFFKKIKRFT